MLSWYFEFIRVFRLAFSAPNQSSTFLRSSTNICTNVIVDDSGIKTIPLCCQHFFRILESQNIRISMQIQASQNSHVSSAKLDEISIIIMVHLFSSPTDHPDILHLFEQPEEVSCQTQSFCGCQGMDWFCLHKAALVSTYFYDDQYSIGELSWIDEYSWGHRDMIKKYASRLMIMILFIESLIGIPSRANSVTVCQFRFSLRMIMDCRNLDQD